MQLRGIDAASSGRITAHSLVQVVGSPVSTKSNVPLSRTSSAAATIAPIAARYSDVAALAGMERFYCHLLSIDAPKRERLWPYPYLDALVVAGILVGPDGRRFTDEGMGGVYATNAVAQLPDPLSAIVIFDREI